MSQRVKKLRDETGLSVQECRKHILHHDLKDEINELECSDQLKHILTTLVDETIPKSYHIERINRSEFNDWEK